MRSTPTRVLLALPLALIAGGLAACGSSDSSGSGNTTTLCRNGKTFTLALGSDPGALDPQGAAGSSLLQLRPRNRPLRLARGRRLRVATSSPAGHVVEGRRKTVTFDLGSGITCSDGSELTARPSWTTPT